MRGLVPFAVVLPNWPTLSTYRSTKAGAVTDLLGQIITIGTSKCTPPHPHSLTELFSELDY